MDPIRPGMRACVSIASLVALVVSLGMAGVVTATSGGPTASAAKKKCKKSPHKCAPKRYHLSATNTVGPGPQSPGFVQNWTAEVDLVTIAKNSSRVVYGAEDGTVAVSGSQPTVCEGGVPATVRIEPQTIPVPRGPGYPFFGDFGVEFTLKPSGGFDKNTYGGPLGTQGSGNSALLATAIDPCPNGQGTFQTQLSTPRVGMEGRGKVGKVVSGSGVFNTIFQQHSFTWKLSPKK
jgi:hypothetical protein